MAGITPQRVLEGGIGLGSKPALDPQVGRRIKLLRQGRMETVGTVTLGVAPATTTVVQHQACSSTSHVSLTPTNAAARTEGIPQVTAGNKTFTLTHSSSAGTRTYSFAIFTPSVA